ncbi:hypothetical protein BH23VER1_BH23VER1_02030 [soil metagenome]
MKKEDYKRTTPRQLVEGDLTEKIIGAAMAVSNGLIPGLDEKHYERALIIELAAQGLEAGGQEVFPVHYRNQHIGDLIPDVIVERRVIVEAKVVREFTDRHYAQLLGYLRITKIRVGLLFNFYQAKLQFERLVV